MPSKERREKDKKRKNREAAVGSASILGFLEKRPRSASVSRSPLSPLSVSRFPNEAQNRFAAIFEIPRKKNEAEDEEIDDSAMKDEEKAALKEDAALKIAADVEQFKMIFGKKPALDKQNKKKLRKAFMHATKLLKKHKGAKPEFHKLNFNLKINEHKNQLELRCRCHEATKKPMTFKPEQVKNNFINKLEAHCTRSTHIEKIRKKQRVEENQKMIAKKKAERKTKAKTKVLNLLKSTYFLSKNNIPLNKLIPLQNHEDDLGAETTKGSHTLGNEPKEILKIISGTISRIENDIVARAEACSVIADESDEMLCVFIKTVRDGDVQLLFLENVKLKNQDAKSIAATILHILKSWKIRPEQLVSLATDGASTMSGLQAGVKTILKKSYPHLEWVHDLSHRLALAMRASLNEKGSLFSKLDATFQSLAPFIMKSSTLKNKLHDLKSELKKSKKTLKYLHKLRWTSSYKALDSLCSSSEALLLLFVDPKDFDTKFQAKCKGYFRFLANAKNLGYLCGLTDLLEILYFELVKFLQTRALKGHDIVAKIKLAENRIESFKLESSTRYKKFYSKLSSVPNEGLWFDCSESSEGIEKEKPKPEEPESDEDSEAAELSDSEELDVHEFVALRKEEVEVTHVLKRVKPEKGVRLRTPKNWQKIVVKEVEKTKKVLLKKLSERFPPELRTRLSESALFEHRLIKGVHYQTKAKEFGQVFERENKVLKLQISKLQAEAEFELFEKFAFDVGSKETFEQFQEKLKASESFHAVRAVRTRVYALAESTVDVESAFSNQSRTRTKGRKRMLPDTLADHMRVQIHGPPKPSKSFFEKCLVDWEDLKERYDKAMMTSTKGFMEKAKARGLELLI